MKHRIRIHKAEPNKGVLDYSHLLDAPAGKHGFVESREGHLYFEDGTRARFLGFNVAARSNTPDHQTADKMAERFASMGVNIIRLHAADGPIGEEPGSWSSCKEAPLLDYESGSSRKFHKEGLDRFDYFAAKLKEKGIYLHIDLIVSREFMEADGLDYPGGAPSCIKRYAMYNERLMELQKEYAKGLLCHINPYTGMALVDDPAVVTVQINNEDSAIKWPLGPDADDAGRVEPYWKEVQRRFSHYLLMKYGTRERLKEAWTHDGVCGLGEEEDPVQETVKMPEGSFYQPVNHPADPWEQKCNPARYADFMEFGIYMNRKFYRAMKDYLRSLGVKVPIVTSNLMAGAADVYGHTDGDLMENNCYFNEPLFPVQGNTYLVAGPVEYVSVNPLTMNRREDFAPATLLSLASLAIVDGKPFMLSEWNEYGEHPFHSTAFLQTAVYACLNDWDGLILYNHHTSEKWDDQPADEILSIFDAYNDPAVVCQWGFLASVFLKGMVSAAKNKVDVVYTQNDLYTLPYFYGMPAAFFPYVTAMRNVFLDGGDAYQGDADLAVNAGFLNGAELSDAGHGIYYAWSYYRDAMRRYKEENRLVRAAKGTAKVAPGVHLGEQALVFYEIDQIVQAGDYRSFARHVDRAMKKWNLLSEDAGYVDGKLISDTKEIVFDPDHFQYLVHTPYCACFSGAPGERIVLCDKVCVEARNERISLTLLPAAGGLLNEAGAFVMTAMGTTGMDETTYRQAPAKKGISYTEVSFKGKLYVETLEGILLVKARRAALQILNPVGEVLERRQGEKRGEYISFALNGESCGVQFYLQIEE